MQYTMLMQTSPLSLASTWDLVADDYAREVAPAFEHYAKQALRLANVQPGARVVDVAAGPGTLSLLAADAGASVDALDVSTRMVDALERRLAAEPDKRARVNAVVGDGMALPYDDAQFDAGFSMFGLMFFPDRAAGLRELLRVLEPRGYAVISSWQPMQTNEVLDAGIAWLIELTNPGGAKPAQDRPAFPLDQAESCEQEFKAAGFANVAVHESVGELRYASARALGESFGRSSAPFAIVRKQLGDLAWARIESELCNRLEQRFGSGEVNVRMPAWLTVGQKAEQ
jgi:ubiquinone/menaquinone biosynthesis C-methylase UbiE